MSPKCSHASASTSLPPTRSRATCERAWRSRLKSKAWMRCSARSCSSATCGAWYPRRAVEGASVGGEPRRPCDRLRIRCRQRGLRVDLEPEIAHETVLQAIDPCVERERLAATPRVLHD